MLRVEHRIPPILIEKKENEDKVRLCGRCVHRSQWQKFVTSKAMPTESTAHV